MIPTPLVHYTELAIVRVHSFHDHIAAMNKSLTLFVLALSMATASPVELVERQSQDPFHSPPYYPAPKGGWAPTWAASYAKAQALVSQMTLAEKVNVTTGVGWSMVISDFSHRYRSSELTVS